MEYTVKTAAIDGDIVPLAAVAECMARAKTTAFGAAPFHTRKFDHFFREYAKLLVEEAQAGRLLVCSHIGKAIDAANIIADPKVFGEPTVMKMDGKHDKDDFPTEPDWELTHLLGLHVALSSLNEWGKATGRAYVVSHEQVVWLEGWKDDKGDLTVTAHWQAAQQPKHIEEKVETSQEVRDQQLQHDAREGETSCGEQGKQHQETQENGTPLENSGQKLQQEASGSETAHRETEWHQNVQENGTLRTESGQLPQHNVQPKPVTNDISARRNWDEHQWRKLYYESIEAGMTLNKLAERYKVSRQAITKRVNKAKGMFGARTPSPFDAVLPWK